MMSVFVYMNFYARSFPSGKASLTYPCSNIGFTVIFISKLEEYAAVLICNCESSLVKKSEVNLSPSILLIPKVI